MRVVTEQNLPHLIREGDAELIHSAYNALDVCVTRESWDALEPRLDANTRRIYGFEHRCQQPAIAMSLRGVLIDPSRRAAAIEHHELEEERAARFCTELVADDWAELELNVGQCGEHKQHLWPRLSDDDPAKLCKRCGVGRWRPSPLNVGSTQQMQKLFYEILKVGIRRDRRTGRPTLDSEALESIVAEGDRNAEKHPQAAEKWERVAAIARACGVCKKARKQIGYARSRTGADGRMRSSFNVGAAETGRWSASKAADWTGWNIQQISDKLRGMVVADPGLEIFQADMQAAESWIVAYDAGSEAYIAAHKTGDPHTTVAKMIYPDLLPWTGELAADKELASSYRFPWDPDHPLRDHMKRVQHGGNMGRTPQGIARQLHIPVAEAEKFFALMYGPRGAFPEIKARHREIAEQLKRTGITISCLGRKRQFLGRVWDEDTVREALGQLEQSPVADILNLALLRVWLELDTRANVWDAPHPNQPNRVWLLAQVHDAILGLYRPGDLGSLRRVKELMETPLELNGRMLTIPVEIQVGPSWAKSEMRKVKL